MKIHDCVQGTPEWLMLRAGIPTASAFDRIVTPSGGESKQQEEYKFRLLAERILGRPIDEKFTWSMERGSLLEKKAVSYYECQRDVDTAAVGLITNDEETWGASPDRTVGAEGLLECKCPELETHIMYLMSEGSAYKKYKVQCQGQLWVTGRQWVDILSYYPGMPWALQRIERDPALIVALEKHVPQFSVDLEQLCEQAREKGWIKESGSAQSSAGHDKGAPRTPNLIDILKESLIAVGREKERSAGEANR